MFCKFGPLALLLAPVVLTLVPAPGPARAATPASVEAEIIRLTNVERQKAGVPPLRASATMTSAAEKYAALMARFPPAQLAVDAHHLDGQDAGDRLANAGYGGGGPFYCAENTAWDYPTADGAVQFWVHHPGHRENLLNPKVTEIGVGVFTTPEGEIRYDQVFAGPPQ